MIISGSPSKFVYCFSMIYNGNNLVKYDKHNDFNIFNGVIAVITFQILFGHKLLFYNIFTTSYTMSTELVIQTFNIFIFQEYILCLLSIEVGFKYVFIRIFKYEQTYKMGPEMSILSIFKNYVDPFFYTTGFLMYVMIKSQLLKRGKSWIKIPMIILYKYLR